MSCILGDIADKRFRILRSMLPFRGLSVCHVPALCSNGRRYRLRSLLQSSGQNICRW